MEKEIVPVIKGSVYEKAKDYQETVEVTPDYYALCKSIMALTEKIEALIIVMRGKG